MNDCITPWLSQYDSFVPHEIQRFEKPISTFLDESAEKFPNHTAIIFPHCRMNYATLRKKAEQFAGALKEAGIQPGERVAMMLPNLPQTIIAFWGIIKAGCVVVMLNPLYREKEILHNLGDAGARDIILLDTLWERVAPFHRQLGLRNCIVTATEDVSTFPHNILNIFEKKQQDSSGISSENTQIYAWKEFCRLGQPFSATFDSPADKPVLLQYTGGTTGQPKGVVLTHSSLGTNALQVASFLNMQAKDKHSVLGILPFFHVYGLCVALVMPAAIAATIIPVSSFVPHELLEVIAQHKPTFFPGAPAMYISLLQQKSLPNYDLRSIRICLSGSAPLPREIFKKFQEITGASILEAYGLTEASPVTHINPYGRQRVRENSIGIPLSSTQAQIVDMDNGALPLPPGKLGELVIRGPQVMPCYWNRPDETANAIRNGWLYTGDLATMDEDGYFYIVDRKKDMAIIGGYNVYPREVDEVLLEHPKILEAVCVGLADDIRGEVLKAYIVLHPGEHMNKSEVVAFCRTKLASYKVPRQVEFRDALPRTIVGKILRRTLRDEEASKRKDKQADL